MTSPTTIKNRVSILVNGVTRLANEVFGSDLPVHAHHQHTELDHDDHLQYMLCSAGPSRPFTGVVYFETGLALRGQVDLNFDDHYRALSAYPTPGIPLSLSAAEWTAFIANYGNASIIGAFNTARNPYTAGTAINITNHVVTNTGVISLCKLGQTPSGGAWSLVEGMNITITQDSVNKRLTIDGQAGGGAYDDSAVFYHSGSRPGTGNWTLYDGSDYHGIGGLVYLRGQADNQTSAFQQVSFTASDGILIEDRIVGSEPDPDRESSITLNQNEAISGAAILVAKLKDADGVLTFGADQSGVYWHDRILRESTDWGAGNPFLLADIVEATNPYDDLYAALGDQRLPLVNILALLAANGGAKLEENAVGYGSSDGLLTGDVDLVSFDPATGLFKVGSGTPEVVSAGLFIDDDLEVTGASSLIGGAWIPLFSSLGLGGTQASPSAYVAWDVRVSPSVEERLLISSSDKIRFTDGGGSLLLSSGVEADYTALAANYSSSNIVSILNAIGISADGGVAKHANVNLVSGTNLTISSVTGGYKFDVSGPSSATLQTAYNAGSTIALDAAKGPVAIGGADPYNNYNLTLSNTLASRTAPLMHITNNSTAEAPAIDFSGSAGDERDYGHRIWSSDDGGVLVLGRGYENGDFASETLVKFSDRITNPYTHIQDAELIARSTKSEKEAYFRATIAPIDSTPSGYSGSVAIGADDAINILSGGDIDISADDAINILSGGDIDISATGNITISPGTGYTDFDNKVARNFDSLSFGSDDADTASFAGSTITASYASGSPDKTVSISANATLVTITKPVGISAGCTLIITASGADRTVQNFHDSVTEADFIIWINGEGNADTSAITIPSGKRAVVSLKWISVGASPIAIGTFNLEM